MLKKFALHSHGFVESFSVFLCIEMSSAMLELSHKLYVVVSIEQGAMLEILVLDVIQILLCSIMLV